MTSRKRRAQAGFTLMELMVVVAIIAMIAVFAVPKLTKNVARTKLTDGVSALSSASSSVLATCATKNALPTSAAALFGSPPNGFAAAAGGVTATFTGNSCTGWILTLTATDTSLPNICAKEVSGEIKFGFSAFQGAGNTISITFDDIPLPNSKLVKADGIGCS